MPFSYLYYCHQRKCQLKLSFVNKIQQKIVSAFFQIQDESFVLNWVSGDMQHFQQPDKKKCKKENIFLIQNWNYHLLIQLFMRILHTFAWSLSHPCNCLLEIVQDFLSKLSMKLNIVKSRVLTRVYNMKINFSPKGHSK